MANLKLDLLNKINNKKYFEEMELVRLAQDPNMNYEIKIDSMADILAKLAILNAQIGGVETYFKEPEPQQAPVQAPAPVEQPQVQQAPAAQVHQGQTHGE